MIFTEKDLSKNKMKKYDSKVINSITPFSNLSYDRAKEVDIFVGRDYYLKVLTETLFKAVYSNRSYGITISGPGGSGKSTLFGYFTQLINNEEIYQKEYCSLKKDKNQIITCFIDAPKGEKTTLKYIWISVIDSLAEENIDFLEKFAILLFSKCLDVLWRCEFKKSDLIQILTILIPNLEEKIKHHNIFDLIDFGKFFTEITTNADLTKKIYSLINEGWRLLQRYEIPLGSYDKLANYDQKRTLKFEKQYFDLLFDSLSSQVDKSTKAQNTFKGIEGDLIKSDSNVITLFNWLTQSWEWIEEKPVVFLIGIDNIGYLTVNIESKEDAYIPFIQTILQMRESLMNCLITLVGTNEDWRIFNNFISIHQDFRTQLQGFIVNQLDLTRLTLNEVIEALTLIMTKFWSKKEVVNPSNPLYPFSINLFTFLYEFFAHEYREMLTFLDSIWLHYKSTTNVISLIDPLFIIKFVRIRMKKYISLQKNVASKSNQIYFNYLINWEKEQIKYWFENLKARHIGKKQSDLVEKKLTEALKILQEEEVPKQISSAEKTFPITIVSDEGSKTRYPDVYVKLTTHSISEKKKAFEIQIKMYDKGQYVKLNDINSSLELLERAYIDALLFLMTGAGLEDKTIDKINQLNLNDRVLYSEPLNDEQFKALAFLVAFEHITGKKPNVNVIKEILEKLFNQTWDSLIDDIRRIGSYREVRIAEDLAEKAKSTLIGYIKPVESINSENLISEENGIQIIEGQEAKVEIENSSIDLNQIEIKPDYVDNIIEELNLIDKKVILKKIYNRYKDCERDLKFIISTATKRTDRYKGKTTKDYLKKKVPPHLSDEEINELFIRLKNDFVKKQVPAEEFIFTYEGTSLVITELGKTLSKIINRLA